MLPRFIFLTGFMGSGKTTLGKKTASLLSYRFIDLDAFIESAGQKTIPDIFKEEGETAFRALETRHLETIITSSGDPVLVSLGGGTICSEKNLMLVKEAGLLVYIEMDEKALVSRLTQNAGGRPLLSQLKQEEIPDFVSARLKKRRPFYERAHLRVNGLNLTPQQLYSEILSASAHTL